MANSGGARARFLGSDLRDDELFVIAGPCVLEGPEMALEIAGTLREICRALGVRLIFKASYRKDNRSAVESFTGPDLDQGLEILARVKREFELPILTDVHCRLELDAAGAVADCLQIPAFLCRQTRLLQETVRHSRCVNVKKGQFLAPDDMARVVQKLRAARPDAEIWLTERGASFGYHNLVVDMRSLPVLREQPVSVVYDVTHSLQHPGSGGDRRFALPLARAAIAAGADGLFFETHPDPNRALSDPTTQLPLSGIRPFLEEMVEWKRLQARFVSRPDPIGLPS